jgi:putative redox protein
VEERIEVDGLKLAVHIARPATNAAVPAVVLCHDFPTPPRGSLASGLTFPELADRIARDIGWMVFTFNFRGTGGSEGDFSVGGWLADQRMAVNFLAEREEVNGIWMVGTGAGGTLALCTAARDQRVRGVATLGAQATLRGWETSRFIDHCRRMGVLRTPGAPADPAAWGREIAGVNAVGAARRLAPRPLLVLHGSEMSDSSALYFQGTTQAGSGSGAVFGDGLRCAGGTVVRLKSVTNVGGASQYPVVGDASVSVKGQVAAPGTRTYQ